MKRRRHRARRWRPSFDWADIGEGLIIGAGLVLACGTVVWLAIHGAPSGRY
ncbi:hypothetical protein ACIHFE_18200 [Streptomyces sp. NPDC052396]|uniref:hypothetical protein n=1 Tax=Streptomyces sp. NPDC052396 TaxID=3365689 RepID=UPI0037D0426D